MEVTYFLRSSYGLERIYLADREQQRTIATLTNATTISREQVAALKSLGVSFKEVPDPKKIPL